MRHHSNKSSDQSFRTISSRTPPWGNTSASHLERSLQLFGGDDEPEIRTVFSP